LFYRCRENKKALVTQAETACAKESKEAYRFSRENKIFKKIQKTAFERSRYGMFL
jgi:hypothetical protein